MPFRPMLSPLIEILRMVSRGRRRQIVPLTILITCGALAELCTIGAIIPLIAIVSGSGDPRAFGPFAALLPEWLAGAVSGPAAIGLVMSLFAVVALTAMVLRLIILWFMHRFILGAFHDLSVALFSRALNRDYAFHISRNTSEVVASVNKAAVVTADVLMPLIQGLSSSVIAAFIMVGLVIIDPMVALLAGAGFGAIYAGVLLLTRQRMRANSRTIAATQTERIQYLREGLGGIRDILIDRTHEHFTQRFSETEARYRDARVVNMFLALAPRYLIEGLGMILLAAVAVMLSARPGGLLEALPALGAFALGAQRLIPLLQMIFYGLASAMGNERLIRDVLEPLADPVVETPVPRSAGLSFESAIEVRDVSFRYADDLPEVLSGISIVIPRGGRIGIVGSTGSGKSTLTDLLLGLLEPSKGVIRIDGVALDRTTRGHWQAMVAHVPQSIYLADGSVTANIAFGVPEGQVDHDRVREVAMAANIDGVIAAMPEGYATRVGERGVWLSGGQRQRIGIARALYKKARFLVLDEATSALDVETEAEVMDAIRRLDRAMTVVIVTHRLENVASCDQVVRIEHGRRC